MNGQIRIWKMAVMTYSKILSQHSLGEDQENYENPVMTINKPVPTRALPLY
jgi:hypothetical protein